ncbi:MAG: hypothetical protein IJP59_08985 [Muribaculaceae bacterium]|nr:hypothetical protein [Muribaculaceae bacterium]
MKKLLLIFAVAGLMASCAGNGTTSGSASASGEVKDGEATEKAEPAKEEKDTVKGPVTIENPSWSVDVPEGWYVVSETAGRDQKGSSYLRIQPLERPDGVIGLLSATIKSYPFKSNTVEQDQETFKSAFKVENAKIEKETIGGMEFQKIVKPAGNGGGIISHMTAPLKPEGNISIEVQGYELTDPVIAAMLKSFKMKPAEPEAK